MKHSSSHAWILPALGAAIIAALAQLSIPIGTVPITLQTLAIGLVATLFKPREATLSALLYLLLGVIGLPVFAGGGGGFQLFLSPSAGYLLAYPLFAFVTSYLTSKKTQSIWSLFLAFILGDSLVFVFGVISLHVLGQFSWVNAISIGVLPFIIPDLLKGLIVSLVTNPIRRALGNHPYFS